MTELFEPGMQNGAEGTGDEHAALAGIKNEAEAAGFVELAATAHLAEIMTEAAEHFVHPQQGVELPTPDEVARRQADMERFGSAA